MAYAFPFLTKKETMKTTILFITALTCLSLSVTAQTKLKALEEDEHYINGIGIRAGTENGLTFKHFYKPAWAVEITGTTGYRMVVGTILIEKHIPLFRNTYVFVGGGTHAGTGSKRINYNYRYGENNYSSTDAQSPGAGLDGVLGVEYKIHDLPFTLGADVKPYVDLVHNDDSGVQGAFSLRYIFK